MTPFSSEVEQRLEGLLEVLGQRPWARRPGTVGSAYGIESDAADIARAVNALPGLLAELSRLRTRCEGLEGALEPFASLADDMDGCENLVDDPDRLDHAEIVFWGMTLGDVPRDDFRAARTALKGDPDDAI